MYPQSNFADPRVIPGAPRSISAHSRVIPGARPSNFYLSQRSRLILEYLLSNLGVFVEYFGMESYKEIVLTPHTPPKINWVNVAPDNRNTLQLRSHVPPDNRNTPQLRSHELWGVAWGLGLGWWLGVWLGVWDLGALGLYLGSVALGLGPGVFGSGAWGLGSGTWGFGRMA